MKKRSFTKILFFFSILLFSSILIPNSSGEDCHDCHGTDGDYTFEEVTVSCETPRVVGPNSDFEHIIILEHPGKYFARDVQIKLDLEDAPDINLNSEDTVVIRFLSKGEKKVSFKLKTGESYQIQRIKTVVSYSANYHYEPTEYFKTSYISVSIDKILLSPSTWSVDIKKGSNEEIEINALESVQNVILIPSPSLAKIVEFDDNIPNRMTKGETYIFNFNAKGTGNGKLNLIYEDENGFPHKITLDISVSKDIISVGTNWVFLGMVNGILSWTILFISAIIGAPIKRLKPALNKLFKSAAIRREVHCGISYILIFLAIFHAIIVMVNHWNGAVLGDSYIFADMGMEYGEYINLGTISWLGIIGVSITGIFWKPIIKIIKYKPWRWTHISLTLLALIASLIHGIVFLNFRFF